MSYLNVIINLGEALADLARDQSEWSQATFGTDAERGPVGALKHLQKEVAEVVGAWEASPFVSESVRSEFADCLLLLLDSSRRAGLKPLELIRAAQAKMLVNKSRKWPKTTGDVPTEHVKEAAELGGES